MPSAYIWRACPVLLGAMVCPELHAATHAQSLPATPGTKTGSESIEFDLDMLKGRNIDPKLASYFADAPRFSEGSQPVSVYVNGGIKGRAIATFDKQGGLIITTALLDAAQLVNPGVSEKDSAAVNARFLKAYPATVVELKPGKSEVWLIVSTDALKAPDDDAGSFVQGGTAAILNYSLLGMNNEFGSGSSEFRSLDTVAGFNAGDWIVRSRQSYTVQDGKSHTEHLYTYGQKTLTGLKSTFQGGQINIANSLFSGDAITGVQLVPEAGLRGGPRNNGAVVEGVANSTARVEVRQNGALIHTTVVPAGPFTLTNLPLLSASTDLDVTVIEADGSRRQFSIASASFGGGTQGAAPGYSIAAGKFRPQTGDTHSTSPNLVTGTGTWTLNRKTNASAGVMLADGYQALGWATDHALTPTTTLGLRQVLSTAEEEGKKGTQFSATLSTQATQRLSLGLSATHQTEGYRELADTTYQQDDAQWYQTRYRDQFTSSVSWSDATLGGFRLSHAYSTQFDDQATQRLIGSWSKSFKWATVSVNVEKSLGETGPYGYGDTAYLSVSMPLGQGSLRTYVNNDQRGTRTGSTYTQQVNDMVGYRVQAERDSTDRETDLSVSTNLLPRYAQASLGYSRNGRDSTTYNGSLTGGIVAHDAGVTFTPYEVNDTFSILSVGDVSGVKVTTPQGPVWTDAGGRAVAPGLAYQNNRMEIAAKSLPRNVDIVNGYKELKMGRGSVSNVDFGVVSTRRVLMSVTFPDGRPLPKGLAVSNGKQYLTTVVDKGQVFLPNVEANAHLTVALNDENTCALDFTLPATAETEGYFETVNAVCRTVQGQPL